MKKYLLPSALILVGFLGYALAQNITKSIQMSQFPNGPIGADSANNVYFPAHILNSGGTPTVATAGGTAATISGTDFEGTITGGGASTTTVIMTFKSAFAAAPNCVLISQNSGTSPLAYNTVTTALNITTNMGAAKASYICSGQS
jgi:hypothetical protein